MCRVSCIITDDLEYRQNAIEVMTAAMYRGGPDSYGHYHDSSFPVSLGHRRLSILDLSAAGHQPMIDVHQRYVLSFNGEIYNFKVLRNELISLGYSFHSNSDTEVVLNGYAAWGIGVFSRLNGMFAIIILDKVQGEVVAARDSEGIKPLYYAKRGDKFYFSSEIRGLKAACPEWDEYEKWSVFFLTFGYIPEPYSTLKNVFHLPKGNYLVYRIKERSHTIKAYHQINRIITIHTAEEAIQKTYNTVKNAVQSHLVSDAPIGVFLSGGVDSSLITMIAQEYHAAKLTSLSIFFEEEKYSEKQYQDIIVLKTGVRHLAHKITGEDYHQELPDILRAMDQPTVDGVNTYFISKYAKKDGLTVVLSGLGADEYFGGYSTFSHRNISLKRYSKAIDIYAQLTGNYSYKKAAFLRHERWYNDYLSNRGLFSPSDTAKIVGCSEKEVNDLLLNIPIDPAFENLDPMNKVSYLETNFYMQNQLLRDSDVFSMWHSLEIRVPFLDKELVQLAHTIDPEVKFNKHQKKFLLIEAFKNELPRQIWDRHKKGFAFPIENYLKDSTILQDSKLLPQKWKRSFLKKKLTYTRLIAIFLQRTFSQKNDELIKGKLKEAELLYVYLCAFSRTGGIEKVNKAIISAISLNSTVSEAADCISLHDSSIQPKYFPRYRFLGFGGSKFRFLSHFLTCDIPWNTVLLSHINLLLVVLILKLRKPSIKTVMMAHGIEVWSPISVINKFIFQLNNQILSVSEFTRKKVIELHGVDPSRVHVLPNCLDPFYPDKITTSKPTYLLERYGIPANQKVLLTVCRISIKDRYKGYESVIKALPEIVNADPTIVYLLAGKYQEDEKHYLEKIAKSLNVLDHIKFTGFLEEDELIDHFELADIFIMPSMKEGFGIVFIEAASLGINVIAGDADGSREALLNGDLGKLVNANDESMIAEKVLEAMKSPMNPNELHKMVNDHFGFTSYRNNLLNKITHVK